MLLLNSWHFKGDYLAFSVSDGQESLLCWDWKEMCLREGVELWGRRWNMAKITWSISQLCLGLALKNSLSLTYCNSSILNYSFREKPVIHLRRHHSYAYMAEMKSGSCPLFGDRLSPVPSNTLMPTFLFLLIKGVTFW